MIMTSKILKKICYKIKYKSFNSFLKNLLILRMKLKNLIKIIVEK